MNDPTRSRNAIRFSRRTGMFAQFAEEAYFYAGLAFGVTLTTIA